ncbi:uncharacterized protein LOC132473239 isoform X7 [Gadus macrocephalus]|uniref:uncharacterized protein LOC132473239 isoform X7 n=1 Tax=Gadus macrocephalus TaxID=80720 RepID=UPI0028CB4DCE|nr:uncharacterized protein LOC132473239 isoform X7 [Gadus macrocephalus]
MRVCICGGCSNSDLLSDHLRFHSFPDRRKDGAGFRAWVHFVQVKRKDIFFASVTKYTFICAAHFRPEDYISGDMMEFKMGFRSEKRVRLKAGVVPSIHAAPAAASGSATGGSEDHGPVRDSTIRKRKLCTIFKAMQLQTFNQDTFRRHTRCFLEPAVVHKWKKEQQILFQKLHQQGKVTVCGGMRADSPGHNTKFSTYSLMHMESNTIIDVQLVKSNEVGGNDHMEMEGMKQSLDLLEQNGLEVDYMVTERQPQILNHLMERKIPQLHDVWVLEKVDKILHNEAVFCDVVQMSQRNQTSFLEAFHSLIQSFAPQKVDLPFMGLLCRLYLAIMHYNENAERKQAGTHPGPAVIKTDPTYNYVDALLKLVFEEVVENPTPFVDELKSIPVPDHA